MSFKYYSWSQVRNGKKNDGFHSIKMNLRKLILQEIKVVKIDAEIYHNILFNIFKFICQRRVFFNFKK